MDNIIKEFNNYIETFLEKQHSNFGNKPICPFAKKARTGNFITYIFSNFELEEIEIELNKKNVKGFNIIIFLNSNKDFDLLKIEETLNKLEEKYPQYEFFSGHPKSEFKVNGIYTRREPYPNILVQDRNFLSNIREIINKE